MSNSYDYIVKWRSVVECNWLISVKIALMLDLGPNDSLGVFPYSKRCRGDRG